MIALLFVVAVAANNATAHAVLEEGRDHYFGADNQSSADYLHLRADGRYAAVDAQHMFTEVSDIGRWRVENGQVILASERLVRNIDAGEFSVHVFDRCGQEMLPTLREKVQALRDRGEYILVGKYGDITDAVRKGDPRGRGPEGYCGASLAHQPDDYPAKPLSAKRLDEVIEAIDAWLAAAETQHRFEYAAWEYRNETFLEPVLPGMHAVQQSADEVREQMDRYNGERASYVLFRIQAKEFEKHANCTYAFQHFQEMNSPCNNE